MPDTAATPAAAPAAPAQLAGDAVAQRVLATLREHGAPVKSGRPGNGDHLSPRGRRHGQKGLTMRVSRVGGQGNGTASAGVRPRRAVGLTALLSAALAVGIVVPALVGAQPAVRPPGGSRALALAPAPLALAAGRLAQPEPGPGTVTLITGERLRLAPGPGGRSAVSVVPPAPKSAAAVDPFVDSFAINGDVYAVPGYALPYLESRLDPRLFDVSYLERAGYAGLASLPLSITWRSARHAPVPGITASGTGRATAGAIRLSSAAAFGRALAQARGRAGRPGAGGPLAQVRKISLGPPPASARLAGPGVGPAVPLAAAARPAGTRLYTLTVNALDRSGRPAYALIAIQNLTDFQWYYKVASITPAAPLAVSVPAGRYGIEATIYDYGRPGFPDSLAFVPVPQVSVTRNIVLTVDARQARPVTVSAPQAAAPEVAGLSFSRVSARGGGLAGQDYGYGPGVSSALPPLQLFAKPVRAPATGTLGFADAWELVPPGSGLGGADVPYTYSLDFASADGVPAALAHVLTVADLAVVQEGFADSVTGSGMSTAAIPFHSWSSTAFALFPTFAGPFPVPATRTDYFGGSASTVWDQQASLAPPTSPVPPPDIFGPYRTFRPGQDLSMTWGASPSVPAPEWQDRGLAAGVRSLDGINETWSYVCPVCRQGDVMSFNVPMSGDGDPAHTMAQFGFGSGILASSRPPTDELKFFRNSVLTQVSGQSGQVFPLLPGRARYEIDWASAMPPSWSQLATSTDSVWKFTSGPVDPRRLPAYELCSPDAGQRCSYLPLVFASYRFGANLQGRVTAPGTETFTVTGYHEAGDYGPSVDQAAVQVSFDDGATWTPATSVTSLGGGRFRVAVTLPSPAATSGFASLKVTLTDAADDSLRQTIIRAFALAGPASAARQPGHGQ